MKHDSKTLMNDTKRAQGRAWRVFLMLEVEK